MPPIKIDASTKFLSKRDLANMRAFRGFDFSSDTGGVFDPDTGLVVATITPIAAGKAKAAALPNHCAKCFREIPPDKACVITEDGNRCSKCFADDYNAAHPPASPPVAPATNEELAEAVAFVESSAYQEATPFSARLPTEAKVVEALKDLIHTPIASFPGPTPTTHCLTCGHSWPTAEGVGCPKCVHALAPGRTPLSSTATIATKNNGHVTTLSPAPVAVPVEAKPEPETKVLPAPPEPTPKVAELEPTARTVASKPLSLPHRTLMSDIWREHPFWGPEDVTREFEIQAKRPVSPRIVEEYRPAKKAKSPKADLRKAYENRVKAEVLTIGAQDYIRRLWREYAKMSPEPEVIVELFVAKHGFSIRPETALAYKPV